MSPSEHDDFTCMEVGQVVVIPLLGVKTRCIENKTSGQLLLKDNVNLIISGKLLLSGDTLDCRY